MFLLRDLYAEDEKQKEDHLTAPEYIYDILIEHPP